MAFKYIVVAVIAAAITLFALQNSAPTALRFLIWQLDAVPLATIMLVSVALGVVLVGVPLLVGRWRLRSRLRALEATLGLALALWARAAAGEMADAPVELVDVSVQSRSDGVRVDVKTSGPPRYRSELMDGPYRLVLDFEDALYHWTVGPLAVDIDPVKTIRGGQFRANVARLVIELTREVPYRVEAHPRGVRVLLGAGRALAPPGEALVPPAEAPKPAPPWRLAGTVLRAEGSTAYIADAATSQVKSYRVGDAIGDGVVETIEERHVVLGTPRGPVELRMEELPPARVPRR